MNKEKIAIHWFRRDLRLTDNHALYKALESDTAVLPLFIFDKTILSELPKSDARVCFIHSNLQAINKKLKKLDSSIYCLKGDPIDIWKQLIDKFDITEVFANEDYEPYGIKRDETIKGILETNGIRFSLLKDHVIFAKNEILKKDNTPYTIYTPYKNKWLEQFNGDQLTAYPSEKSQNFFTQIFDFPTLSFLGFETSSIKVLPFNIEELNSYNTTRDFPSLNGTSKLGPHLRFGTFSIREIVAKTKENEIFLSELIWREFFMQILYHFPKVVTNNFKKKYDGIVWRNNLEEFNRWKKGETGYPLVDAGIRELNKTGYMHNRVRMVVAGFLCKHLLIDWRWGEAYFASKLLDYELSANNGNWQWSSGTGCDSAPYFRVFNPTTQIKRFDSELTYIKKWVPEIDSLTYPTPMVEHKYARERAISTYKEGIN